MKEPDATFVDSTSNGGRPKYYDFFILILSLYVLVVLALGVILNWSEETQLQLDRVDLAICIVFLADWFYFLAKSSNKSLYFKTRLVDLIASIPFATVLRGFRIVRAVRIIRTFRMLRGARAISYILRLTAANKRVSSLVIYVMCTTLVYFYCSVGIYNFEHEINQNMHNYGDALWLCFTTLTTVGYGDIFPVTAGGRVMSAVLVLMGIGLFSLVTAELAAVFLQYIRDERAGKSER